MLMFLSLGAFFLLGADVAVGEKRRVCYHTNWSQYRPGLGKFVPSKIDPFICTHIAYSFAKLSGNHLDKFEWNDEKMYKETMLLKKKNPALKVILSVGGWNMGSAPFTKMVATPNTRADFIKHAITFLRKYQFDGLDLDWEYPANRGSPATDKQKFADLIKETRKAFYAEAAKTKKQRLSLSAAVSAGKNKIDTGYMVPIMAANMDFITLMTYDLHGGWEKKTGHNAPLFKRSDETGYEAQLNIAWAAEYWVSKGAPKNKLNIGLALYGRGFALSNPANHKPGAPASGPCPAGKYTREKGYLSYYEICQMIKKGGKIYRMKDAKVPYLIQGNQWIGYDDPESLRFKVNWANKEGYGGIAVWALPLDDFANTCKGGKFPLMKAIVAAMKGVPSAPSDLETDTTENEASPNTKPGTETNDSGSGVSDCSKDGFFKKTCDTYIWCYSGQAHEKRCPPGTAFSTEISQCNFKSLVPGC